MIYSRVIKACMEWSVGFIQWVGRMIGLHVPRTCTPRVIFLSFIYSPSVEWSLVDVGWRWRWRCCSCLDVSAWCKRSGYANGVQGRCSGNIYMLTLSEISASELDCTREKDTYVERESERELIVLYIIYNNNIGCYYCSYSVSDYM